jgi:hypothetical protein
MSHAEQRPRIAGACVCCGSRSLSKSPAVLMPFVASRVFGWEPVEIDESWHLRDIRCGMAYSICNTLRCDECGLIFLDLRFDDSEMASLYAGYRGEEYTALRSKFEPDYESRNDDLLGGYDYIPHVESFLRDRIGRIDSVLDWGGDTGLNTPFRAEVAVHHVHDISDKPVIQGARKVEPEEALRNQYDLIVISQVLEHVSFPRDIVEAVVGVMKPGTALWVEVPHEAVVREAADPELAYLDKRHWHEHVNFYTESSLTALFEGAGLVVTERTDFPVTVSGKTSYVLGAICHLPE